MTKRGTIALASAAAAAALLASPADAFVVHSRSLPSSAAGSLSPSVLYSAAENDEKDTTITAADGSETPSINGANGDASAPSPTPSPSSPAKEATEAIVDMINEVATAPQRTILLNDLLRTASSCGRGEFATPDDKTRMAGIIAELEELNPTDEPTMSTSGSGSDDKSSSSKTIEGTWELLYSDTQLFRSSPFFMAGRAVCSTPEEAERYDWFCDMHRAALAISNIGKVRQIISADRMVSEFEVKVGSIPFLNDFTPFAYSGGLPVTIEGAIVSSADITPTDEPVMSTSVSGSDDNSSSSKTIEGTWELLYSDTQLFRSSPFFMAGRAVCSTPEEAERYDWFCDMHRAALAISNIGKVRQIISSDRMVSEFEVKVGSIPFLTAFTPFAYSGGLPVTIEGAIVSSADITPTDDGRAWEIFMDTVEIKGSNVPLLRQILDGGVKLGSRDLGSFLEDNVDSYTNPKPVFETTYLDDGVRISRDQDGKVFVYGKVDDSTEPTDYKNVDADLGVAKLLEGLNDSIFKFYI